MTVNSGYSANPVKVDEEGYLLVCLCDETCDHAASLQDLLAQGYGVLLHVRDKNGKIIPMTEAGK